MYCTLDSHIISHIGQLVGIQLETTDHTQFGLMFSSPSSVSISELRCSCKIELFIVIFCCHNRYFVLYVVISY